MEDILDGIANFELTKRRMQVEKNKLGATIINDCYNAKNSTQDHHYLTPPYL